MDPRYSAVVSMSSTVFYKGGDIPAGLGIALSAVNCGIICASRENNMSRLSFKSFCIEFYARHIGSTGADVYRMFSESGLLKTLDDDYEDLHGLGWEALMPMFDEYLGRSAK